MKVIIIGNGFDISLGHKTQYSDFLKSWQFNELVIKENSIAVELKNKFSVAKWVDIELELAKIPEQYHDDSYSKFRTEYLELCNALEQYLCSLDYERYDKNSKAYKFISTIIQESSSKNFIIFDFNYTPTLKNILFEYGIDPNGKIIKVHGDLQSKIIFGIHDNAGSRQMHVLMKKTAKEKFKHINLDQHFRSSNIFYFFGYSFGKTDEMYFKDMFVRASNGITDSLSVNIYHYGEEGREEVTYRINDLVGNNLAGFRKQIEIGFVDVKQD